MPVQPPKIVPPGKQNILVPQKPQIFPRGPQNKNISIAPPKPVVPIKGFRSRPKNEAEQVLCPDCAKEKASLCPDCARENASLCPDCSREEASKTYQPTGGRNNLRGKSEKNGKYSSKTYQNKDFNDDNYKYHEINETTDKNKKSLFYVKKEGVIISTNA